MFVSQNFFRVFAILYFLLFLLSYPFSFYFSRDWMGL